MEVYGEIVMIERLKSILFVDNVLLIILKMVSVGQYDIIKSVVFVLVWNV